jgi:hypothetical protein
VAEPTLAARRARRVLVLSGDAALLAALRAVLPPEWTLEQVGSLAEAGEFQDLLLHRFVLLDLEHPGAGGAVREIRSEMMLNVPIFCFGGDPGARDAARLARADRCFEREELAAMLPQLCEAFAW